MKRELIQRLIVGESPAVTLMRERIARLAPRDVPVLIEGLTGAGKELVAQALHRAARRSGSLVAINACAIAESMFESALFGHVKGAFTGALRDHTGFLGQANGGTLFLDEIGSLPLGLQGKLLRALETGSFRPVGATVDRTSEFRLVSATNEDLRERVAAGTFRRDLLHRLRGATVRVPALSERLEDVPILARYFASQFVHDNGEPPVLSRDGIYALQLYSWPGNVRELRQVIACAVALADTATIGGPEITEALGEGANASGDAAELEWARNSRRSPLAIAPDLGPERERAHLLHALERERWNPTRAAGRLGVSRATLYRRMRDHGIERSRRRPLLAASA